VGGMLWRSLLPPRSVQRVFLGPFGQAIAAGLPNYRQVAAGQECEEAKSHGASKCRPNLRANHLTGWVPNGSSRRPSRMLIS
jgi:hypothetical protein